MLDSLQFSGRVIIAETGKTDSTLLVMLYRALEDSAVVKERPRYVTRVDNSGNFTFRNLPAGTFAIYSVKDEGGQRRYMGRNQLLTPGSYTSFPALNSRVSVGQYHLGRST